MILFNKPRIKIAALALDPYSENKYSVMVEDTCFINSSIKILNHYPLQLLIDDAVKLSLGDKEAWGIDLQLFDNHSFTIQLDSEDTNSNHYEVGLKEFLNFYLNKVKNDAFNDLSAESVFICEGEIWGNFLATYAITQKSFLKDLFMNTIKELDHAYQLSQKKFNYDETNRVS